jgi:WD40 repeat protein
MKIVPLSQNMPALLYFASSENFKTILTGFENQTAVLWNTENNRYKVFNQNSASIHALDISKEGTKLAIQSEENLIKVYNSDATFICSLQGHKETIKYTKISPKSDLILTGGEDNLIKLWDINTCKIIKTIKSHIDPITSLGFSSDQNYFFSTSEDGYLRIWNKEYKLIKEFKDHTGPVMHAEFASSAKKIVSGGDDGKLILYDLNKQTKISIDAHTNSVRSVSISKDETYILSSSEDRTAKLWTIEGKLIKTFKGHEGNINRAIFFGDKNHILTGSDDGTHILYDKNGKILCTIIVTEHGKIVHSPDGRFDYDTEKLDELVFYHQDDTELDIDTNSFYQLYFTPGLFYLSSKGKNKPIDKIEQLYSKSPPPEVKMKITQNNESASVEVTACDQGGGIGDLYLYQNKVLVQVENSRAIRLTPVNRCIQRNYQIKLLSGTNQLQAAASSEKGLVGFSSLEVKSFNNSSIKKSKLHLYIVSIDEYKESSLNLKYAVKDGYAFRNKILQKSRNFYEEIIVNEIYNQEASKSGIQNLFKKNLDKLNPNDSAIFFFSGHGISTENNYFFISTEFNNKKENLKNTSLSQEELTSLISNVDVMKKLVILDTCQSGGDWMNDSSFLSQEFSLGVLSKLTGITVIASSMQNQVSYESSKLGHGLLTKSILEALENKGEINTSSLIPYVNKRVPELSNLLLKKEQFPFISFRGRDFLLTQN